MSRSEETETFDRLVEVMLTEGDPGKRGQRAREVLDQAFADVKLFGWKLGLGEVGRSLRGALDQAHARGLPPEEIVVKVSDLLLVVSAMAERGPGGARLEAIPPTGPLGPAVRDS